MDWAGLGWAGRFERPIVQHAEQLQRSTGAGASQQTVDIPQLGGKQRNSGADAPESLLEWAAKSFRNSLSRGLWDPPEDLPI